MDSYQAALQKLKAQRQQQLGEVQQQTDENMPMFQQDRNRTALMNEQNKRRIRDLMARFNTVGGGQNMQIEMDANTDMTNNVNASYDKEKAFKNAQASKMQNVNSQFDAAESEALTNYQEKLAQASKMSASQEKASKQSELNSVYVALNSSIDDLSADGFLKENRDDIISKYGQDEFNKMMDLVIASRPFTNKKYVAKNINTTPMQYQGANIYS